MKKTLLALAMFGSIGAATNAQAYAYAVSYDEVSNFVIGRTNVTILNPVINNSNALACLPNGTCVATGGTGIQDAAPANIGLLGYTNNGYILPLVTAHEANATSFSVADADITGTPGLINSARNFAEAKILENNTANGTAGNSSIQSIQFETTGNGSLTFEFDASPYIRAFLTPGSAAGSLALGSLSVNINIVGDANNIDPLMRGVVFNWAPDGVGGNNGSTGTTIQGGFETADSFTLNTSVTATSLSPTPGDYNPTQCTPTLAQPRCFSAYTGDLAVGLYTLNVVMTEKDDLRLVPEPGSIMLFGIGLAALGGITRRRSISPALPALPA